FKFKWPYKLSIIVLGFLLSIVFMIFPIILTYQKEWLIDLIKDEITKQNLMASVNWSLADAIPGAVLFIVILLFISNLYKAKSIHTFGALLVGNALVIWILTISFTGKIEQHTQGTAIEFFKSIKKENCYIFNAGYKSYAPYFYGNTRELK